MRHAVTLMCALVWALSTSPARADLIDDVTTLRDAYAAHGAVRRLTPRFLIAGETRAIELVDARDEQHGCLSLIVLAERPLSFSVRPTVPKGLGVEPRALRSQAGYVAIEDCGRGALGLGSVDVSMGSQRGTVEVVVVTHAAPLTPLEVILPERALGPAGAHGEVAGGLKLAPLDERVTRAEEAARRDGAVMVVRVPTRSDERGAHAIGLKLRGGCHRVAVLTDQGAARGAVDVDAEVRLPGASEPLAHDRSHAPDARLDFCIGTSTTVELRLAGTGGPVPVMVLDAYWRFPAPIEGRWGDEARAGIAWALHRRRAPAIASAPIETIIGTSSATLVPIRVEPNACYLAAATVTRGDANGGRLSASIDGDTRYDDMNELPRAAALSFCTGPKDEVVRMEVDVRGRSIWWLMAVWRLGR